MDRKSYAIVVLLCVFGLISCKPNPILYKTMNRQLKQIGSAGSEPGYFKEPRGLEVLPSGNLLITDFRNYRIQELSPDGKAIASWGEKGDLPGQFNDPVQAVIDSAGNLYVADTWHHKIQKRTASGEWIENWASGSEFYAPRGIAVDKSDRIYVTNTSYHCIKVFDPDGSLKATWGKSGAGQSEFHDPVGICAGPDGKIYIADTGNQRIKVMDTSGATLQIIPVPELEKEKFHESYLAVTPDSKILITLPHLNLIQIYTPDGQIYSRFGDSGSGPEQLYYPTGIAVDSSGKIYISDTLNNRIVQYDQPAPLEQMTRPKPNTAAKVFSYFRWMIDLIALTIIIIWVVKRIKQSPGKPEKSPEPPKDTAYLRWRENLGKKSVLLTVFYLIGWGLAIFSVLLFYQNKPSEGSLAAIAALLVLVFHEIPKPLGPACAMDAGDVSRKWFWILMILLVAATVFFRVHDIRTIPYGINNDAAWNGTFALRFLDGEKYTPFTSEAWGKETLYMYMIAASFKLFGVSRFTILIPCMIASIITVIAFFFLSRLLFGSRFAFVSSFIFSATAWNIIFARTGYRAVLAPLSTLLSFWLFYRAIDATAWKSKLLSYAGAGLFIGLGLHTYFSFRAIPLMMIIVGIFEWFKHPKYFKNNWWGWILLISIGFAVFSPLFFYAINNWHTFMSRSDFLFIGKKVQDTGSIRPLWDNIVKNLLLFHYKAAVGNFFNNDWPIVSRILGLLMLGGGAIFLRHFRSRQGFFLITLFFFGSLPSLLSEPDAARSNMLPIVIAFFATASIFGLLRFSIFRDKPSIKTVFLVAMTLLPVGSEFYFYFYKLSNDYYAQFGYAGKHTRLGETALAFSKDYQIYISQGHFIDTTKFYCYGLPGNIFAITGGEVIDVVPRDRLMKNIEEVLGKPVPEGKGLAFILEETNLNKPVFQRIKDQYPNGHYQGYRDPRFGNEIIFYTYIIPKDMLQS